MAALGRCRTEIIGDKDAADRMGAAGRANVVEICSEVKCIDPLERSLAGGEG